MSDKVTPLQKQRQPLQRQGDEQASAGKKLAPPPFQLQANPAQLQDAALPQLTEPTLGSSLRPQMPSFGLPPLQMPGTEMPRLQNPSLLGPNPFALPPSLMDPAAGLYPGLTAPSLLSPTAPAVGPREEGGPQLNPNMFQPPLQDDFLFMQSLRGRLPLVGGILSDDAILSINQVNPQGAAFEDQDGQARTNPDGSPMNHWSQLSPEQIDEQLRISRLIAERRHLNLGWDGPFNNQGLGASYQWRDGRSFNMGAMPLTNEASTGPMGLDGARLGIQYNY